MNFTELKPGTTVEGAEIHAFKSEGKSTKYTYLYTIFSFESLYFTYKDKYV